jgi:hypothetical protein
VNDFQKDCVVERFAQKLHRAITNGTSPHFDITTRSDEDDRY